MHWIAIVLCVIYAGMVQAAESRQMAITFDDLPVVSAPDVETAHHITTRLLAGIRAERVPAIGFVNEGKLQQDGVTDPGMINLLKMWVDAGLELGNHSYSHFDINKTHLPAFQDDVIRGEKITREILNANNKQLIYFRHPFLHAGNSPETKNALNDFLKKHGYLIAPVTIDNSEWIFARAYQNATDGDSKERIAAAYIEYMMDKIDYYEKQSILLTGRNISHVLLLHANSLNADHFPRLAKAMREKGYEFITLSKALEDEAYELPDTYTGAEGISWIHRWALTRGVEKGFFQGEPLTPAFVMEIAGIKEE